MRKSILAISALAAAGSAQAAVVMTYEAAGLQETTATFDYKGIERFDSRGPGNAQFTSNFETTGMPTVITGVYTGAFIRDAGIFGGAGGTGKYTVIGANPNIGYTLKLSTSDGSDLNYFGYWLSALDIGNRLEFFKEGTMVNQINYSSLIERLGTCPDTSNPYCGNPTGPFLGQNANEAYAFINLYFTNGDSFDEVRFYSTEIARGYESDNHTVGYWIQQAGNPVPEPTSWAMMIMGFGLVGSLLRRRNSIANLA